MSEDVSKPGGYLSIRNWSAYQNPDSKRRKRQGGLPWFKVYSHLWDQPEFLALKQRERYVLISLFHLANRYGNRIPNDRLVFQKEIGAVPILHTYSHWIADPTRNREKNDHLRTTFVSATRVVPATEPAPAAEYRETSHGTPTGHAWDSHAQSRVEESTVQHTQPAPRYGDPPAGNESYPTEDDGAHPDPVAHLEALDQGLRAGRKGLPRAACPYPEKGDVRREPWVAGWGQGIEDRKLSANTPARESGRNETPYRPMSKLSKRDAQKAISAMRKSTADNPPEEETR